MPKLFIVALHRYTPILDQALESVADAVGSSVVQAVPEQIIVMSVGISGFYVASGVGVSLATGVALAAGICTVSAQSTAAVTAVGYGACTAVAFSVVVGASMPPITKSRSQRHRDVFRFV